jgi:hypothetical protein
LPAPASDQLARRAGAGHPHSPRVPASPAVALEPVSGTGELPYGLVPHATGARCPVL